MGYIEDILELSSYHVQIKNYSSEKYPDADKIKGIKNTVPFFDIQCLVQGKSSRLDPVIVRAVENDSVNKDISFLKQLNLENGSFSLEDGIIIGHELARMLRLHPGDSVSLMGLSGNTFNRLTPDIHKFKVSGIFKCGYYEYDRNLAFISTESGEKMRSGESGVSTLGIKIDNIYKDREIVSKLKDKFGSGIEIVSWRDYNRAFFSALRMEKYQ